MNVAVVDDFQINPLPHGVLQLVVKMKGRQEPLSLLLSPDQIGPLLSTFAHLVTTSKHQELRQWANLWKIRDVEASCQEGVPILAYEVEAGLQLVSQISTDQAKAVSDAWAKLGPGQPGQIHHH